MSDSVSKVLPEARHKTAMTAPARILLVPRPEHILIMPYTVSFYYPVVIMYKFQ